MAVDGERVEVKGLYSIYTHWKDQSYVVFLLLGEYIK